MCSSRPRNDPRFSSCRPQNHSQLILGIEWHPRTMDQAKRFHYATRSISLMASILDQFVLDFSKLYRQIDLFASDSLIFLAKVAFIKTMSAAIAFFSPSPFFLLALSFSPFLFLRYCDFGAYRAQKTCLIFTQMTADFVKLVFKKLG